MVTMYFIYLYTATNSTQLIPHNLPLFKDKVVCEEVVKQIEHVAPTGAIKCLPIKVEVAHGQ